MAMVVKNNMSSINAQNILNNNTNALSKSLKKVASGMKINSAADDASGYAISEKMRVNIRSLNQANQNAQNGSSMLKVAEGAVSSTVEILKTMKEKAVSAANDTNTDADRATIQKELDQSIDQINDNANITFNGQYLVDGSKSIKSAAVTTAMTNLSLSTDTATDTKLTALKAANGDSLNIQSTDTVTISYVKDGKTFSSNLSVADMTLNDAVSKLTGDAVKITSATSVVGFDGNSNQITTASGNSAITIQAASSGIANQIAGFTMYITDNTGSVRKSANAVLDAFDESIRAKNESKTDNAVNLQIGAKAGQSIKVGMTDMKAVALGLQGQDSSTVSVGNREKANAAINVFDSALKKALDQMTDLGAAMSRLEYTSSNLTTAAENVQAAESTIRDADMAKEMTEYTKNNVLMQAAQSMLSQSNQNSSNALNLLR